MRYLIKKISIIHIIKAPFIYPAPLKSWVTKRDIKNISYSVIFLFFIKLRNKIIKKIFKYPNSIVNLKMFPKASSLFKTQIKLFKLRSFPLYKIVSGTPTQIPFEYASKYLHWGLFFLLLLI